MLVDGPASIKEKTVPRHSAALSDVALTPIVIEKLPRAIGTAPLKAAWEKAEVEKKFETSSWAQGRARIAKRKQLNDFERFKVMRLRKQVCFQSLRAYWLD